MSGDFDYPDLTAAPTATAHDVTMRALKAVLVFHDGRPWDREHAARWKELTGHEEATTRNLCDVVRAAIARAETGSLRRTAP